MNELSPIKAWNITKKDNKLLRQCVRDYIDDEFGYEGNARGVYISRYVKYVNECKAPHRNAVKNWFMVRHMERNPELDRLSTICRMRLREIEKLQQLVNKLEK